MNELQSIRIFALVAREKSFSRAAEQLHISIPLVSRHVRALEDRLKVRLIHRSTRRQSLTEVGELYLERIEKIIDDIDDITNCFSVAKRESEGVLRISAPYAFGLSQLSSLLERFMRQTPSVRPYVTLTDASIDFSNADVDVAILSDGMLAFGSHKIYPLAVFELIRVAAPRYLEDHGGLAASIAWPDIEAVHLDLSAAEIANGAPALGLGIVSEKIGVGHLEMIRQLAMGGMGAAVLPAYLVNADLAAGTLVRVMTNCQRMTVTLKLAHARVEHMSMLAKIFIEFVCSEFGARAG